MGPHDLVTGDGTVRCACGRSWPDLPLEKQRQAHEAHFQVERARAALRGDEEDAD